METKNKLNVLHIASGDLWAGAECQIYNMLTSTGFRENTSPVCLLLNGGVLEKRLKDAGIKVHVIPESKYSTLQIISRCKELFKNQKIDIVHSHKYKESTIALFLASSLKIPVKVKTLHGWVELMKGFSNLKLKLYRQWDFLMSRFLFNATIAVSNDMARFLKLNLISKSKIITIPNSIDIQMLKNCGTPACDLQSTGLIRVGAVGRLVGVKGLEYLIIAFSKLCMKYSGLRLTLIGDGPDRSKLERICGQLGILDKVEFAGFVENPYSLMNKLDIYIMPSLHEGFPTALLEAMALGKPVIASSVGGIKEVLVQNVNGLLVEPGNVDMLSDSIAWLIDHNEDRHKLAINAQRTVIERYTNDIQGERLVDLYYSLIKSVRRI